MSSDASEKVTKLLRLAADGAEARTNEAINAALRAARLFKESHQEGGVPLLITDGDPKSVTCKMCMPATAPGQCHFCGFVGMGPGHSCRNPEAGTLCKVHATWTSNIPVSARPPPQVMSHAYGPFVGMPYGMPVYPQPTLDAIALGAELAAERLRTAALEKEVERLQKELEKLRSVATREPIGELGPATFTEEQAVSFFLPIEALELSRRAMNALGNRHIMLVGELVQLSEDDLLKTKNLWKKSVREIRGRLRDEGLSLGMRIPDWAERLERWKATARKESAA